MRTRIKICGITNLEDAQAAAAHGADALGFIFVPDTPRCVTTEIAYDIGFRVSPFITKVAVVHDFENYNRVMPRSLDAVQYYVNTKKRVPAIGPPSYNHRRRMRAYRVRDMESLHEVGATCSEAFAILLDTYHKDKLGGAGETFNWQVAVEAKQRFGLPIILAGGLTPENVGEAVRTVRPYAVDVASGVEASPGRKDHAKMKAFIDAVWAADAEA